MRIYSKFKDYYDPALKEFEAEPTPVYDRTTQLLPKVSLGITGIHSNRNYYHPERRMLPISNDGWGDTDGSRKYHMIDLTNLGLCIIGFCGKLYAVYSDYTIPVNGKGYYGHKGHQSSYLSMYRKLEPALFTEKPFLNYNHYGQVPPHESVHGFDQLESAPALKALFVKHMTPAFIYRCFPPTESKEKALIINPHLGDIGFQKVMNPWQAMQEIHMFLGNELVQDKQPIMPVGSDKIIAESKGFDKWSFRKPPEV